MTDADGGEVNDSEPIIEPDTSPASDDSNPMTIEADAGTPVVGARDLKVVNLVGVSVDLPSPHPTIVLREIETPWRELRMSIGYSEGMALTHAWRRLPAPRPLTHEVWADVLAQFNVSMEVVRILDAVGSVYFAEMVLVNGTTTIAVPCRPTDAIILSLRQPLSIPILVADAVLERGSV